MWPRSAPPDSMSVSHRSTAARIVSSSRSASRMIMTSYGRNDSGISPFLLRSAAGLRAPGSRAKIGSAGGADGQLSNREKVSDHLERPIGTDPTHGVRHAHSH